MPIRWDEFRRCLTIEVGDKASEVWGKTKEFEYSDQLAVVRRGGCPFEVKVAEDNLLLVGVSILHTEA